MTDERQKSPPQSIVWTKELVTRFWNGLAEAELDDIMSFGRMAKRSIYWLIARKLTLDGRHLDYGSGGGEVAMHLMEHGFPFSVYEPSVERQRRTNLRLTEHSSFLGAPAQPGSQSYDAVTCFEVLEHVLDEDFERVCDDLAGHVRPGGYLIISTPNNEDLRRDTVFCPVSNTLFHRWQHVRSVSPSFLGSQFRGRGFEKICLHQLDFNDALFEPFLHHLGFPEEPGQSAVTKDQNPMPLHIHQILHDIDSVMGGATRILYIGKNQGRF